MKCDLSIKNILLLLLLLCILIYAVRIPIALKQMRMERSMHRLAHLEGIAHEENSNEGWLTEWYRQNDHQLREFLTVSIIRQDSETLYRLDGSKPLDKEALILHLERFRDAGCLIDEVIIYTQDDVTAADIKETVEMLRSFKAERIIMFGCVEGIITDVFE